MKIILPTLISASICLLAPLHADLTIVQKVDGLGQDIESTTKIKGGETRVDASPATSVIMNLKTGEIISLMNTQKQYMKIPSQIAQAAVESIKKTQSDPASAPSLVATGKKDTISGYAAQEYTCNVGGAKVTLWLTTALPNYQTALKEMAAAFNQGPLAAMMKNLGVDFATLPGFPLRTVNEVQPGQTMTSTVVSVSTASIPDADFNIPAGYQELKMPSLTPPAAGAAPALSK